MHALLQLLSEYQLEVETRAFAHYSSSKYHRRQGVLWGIAASGFTGFASLAALAGGASKLGALTMFETLLGSSGLFVMVFSAIILFALATASALAAFLAHPKQAASHMASYAGYSHAMRRLETLRLRCANLSNVESELGALLNLLDEISQEIKDVAAASIYPLPEAYREGKIIKQSNSEFKKEWDETFSPRLSPIKSHTQSEA
jgi:hypothetical protein